MGLLQCVRLLEDEEHGTAIFIGNWDTYSTLHHPRRDNTQIEYGFRSDKDPLDSLRTLVRSIKYTYRLEVAASHLNG